jgi:glutaredoxin 3
MSAQALVVVYGRTSDPYTVRARALLNAKGIHFTEKTLPEHLDEMQRVTGAPDGPQILIGGRAIGGFDALGSLELRGELDRLVQAPSGMHLGKDLSKHKE